MLEWISEGEALPKIGQKILLVHPCQSNEFWKIESAWLMARHEDVVPRPIKAGERWPTDYAWQRGEGGFGSPLCLLVTGNGWWASLEGIPLPPGAAHRMINGYHCVEQTHEVFIPQAGR